MITQLRLMEAQLSYERQPPRYDCWAERLRAAATSAKTAAIFDDELHGLLAARDAELRRLVDV